MSDPLATYLQDHLAGSNFAIELLKHLNDQQANEPLGHFAAALLVEVEQDREVLERIVASADAELSAVKEATAWVTEKMSRFKLSRAASGEAGTFQALEALSLGILGKRSLWRALSLVAPTNTLLPGEDYNALAARAQSQYDSVEQRRLEFAARAFNHQP